LSARVPRDLVAQRVAAGLSRQPLGAIVTRSGNLPPRHPHYASPTVIYVTGSDRPVELTAVEVIADTVEIRHVADVSAVVNDLAQRHGARRILCEGGPTLNAALFEAGLVDELFLTVAPRLLGGNEPLPIIKGGNFGQIRLELRTYHTVDNELFLKYGVLPPA
jgi:riboflavin biosynthesis pyrimidine reductase